MIKIYKEFDTKLSREEVVLSLKTTGINHHKNKVFMITIITGEPVNNIIQLLSESENEEIELLSTACNIIGTKKVITYNGNSFDKKFLQKGALKNDIFDIYEIKTFLKQSVYFNMESYKLSNVLKELSICAEECITEKELINIYKKYVTRNNTTLKEQILSLGLESCFARYSLYLTISDTMTRYMFSVNLFDTVLEIFLYKQEIKGDFIYFYYHMSTQTPPVDIIKDNIHIFSEGNYLVFKFQYSKGMIDSIRTGYSVITPIDFPQKITLKKNHILIAIENIFDYETINNLVKLVI